MSVINQMLKDLDKRQEPVSGGTVTGVPVQPAKNSSTLVATVSILATLVVVAVIYLYFENKSLKAEQGTPVTPQPVAQVIKASPAPIKQNDSATYAVIEPNAAEVIVQKASLTENTDKSIPTENVNKTPSAEQQTPQYTQSQRVIENDETSQDILKVASISPPSETVPLQEEAVVSKAPKPVLNIARRNMSADELVATKMAQAEQAMTDREIKKAEQLFEEVLLVKPTDHVARKQLAALLYGRQDVQSAVNILAQGIQLAPQDSEMRLMLAKIYVDRNAQKQALNVLMAQSDVRDIEYQSLIATLAQSMSEFENAKQAYDILIRLQGRESRWHLGAAIAHDSLGEFSQARVAYDNAIGFGSLSESAMAFAKQRLQELGDK